MRGNVREAKYESATYQDLVDVRRMIADLWQEKKTIIGISLSVLLLSIVYAYTTPPVYQSRALIHVQQPGSDTGMEAESGTIIGGIATPVNTETEIIQSRVILGEVVDKLNLDIVAEPKYLPLFGEAVARRNLILPAVFDNVSALQSFAWGGEKIDVKRFSVPNGLIGTRLTLVITEPGAYEIYSPEGRKYATGRVGETEKFGYDNEEILIHVSELEGRPGTAFQVHKRHRTEAVETLRRTLRVSTQGAQTGLMQAVIEGNDPAKITETLTEVAHIYIRQNVAMRAKEAEKTLDILSSQLPALKNNLESAESRLNSYLATDGNVNANLETERLLEQLNSLEQTISALQIDRDEFEKRYTPDHPSYVDLTHRLMALEEQKTVLRKSIQSIPGVQMHALRLQRDVDVANELYVRLLNKAQEIQLIKTGTVSSARVIDLPVLPVQPLRPQPRLLTMLGAVMGLVLAVAVAWLKIFLRKGMADPAEIERAFQLPVFASIMESSKQSSLERRVRKNKGGELLLANIDHDSATIEALRSLRTMLYFSASNTEKPVISITGPAPGIGKSFVATNLSLIIAATGKRVLLIDADLRKGRVHEAFGIDASPGLSNLLVDSDQLDSAFRQTSHQSLTVLPRGEIPPNPSELLAEDRFLALIQGLRERYDMVIIDSPPVLSVTDPTIIGNAADLNLMVLRSSFHPMREIEAAVRQLSKSGILVNGFVINRAKESHSYYGVGYHYKYA